MLCQEFKTGRQQNIMKISYQQELEYTPASHENPDAPGVFKKVLAGKSDLIRGQVQMVNWSRLPVGSSFQPHFHEDMQEVFIICSGTASMTVNGQSHSLGTGDAITIDPREIHVMQNTCNEDVNYVVFGISKEEGGKTVVVAEAM